MDEHPEEAARNDEPDGASAARDDATAAGQRADAGEGTSGKFTAEEIAKAKVTQKRRFFTLLVVGIVILVIAYMAGSNARQHASADCGDSSAVSVVMDYRAPIQAEGA
ncbi:MAG: hypothetical protein LKK54_04245 [Ancrocorticia sp.]|jgi:hypothetical protein|nr:hypothetical protein [Ancrocorticia sp.]MCI1963147.1 hypothetical protein [Ancrocorticia sp.]MCI2001515.1 hypothetical protein [Ancrocorticia sp.]MCI2030029.1 hypothetical protein [Ancrocorticia sp.]MCI2178652.1 hypothetical protein [Ancrocorticia sp.]